MNLIVTVEALAGAHISTIAKEMAEFARKHAVCVRSEFNGVHLFAHPKKSAAEIEADWERDFWGRAK